MGLGDGLFDELDDIDLNDSSYEEDLDFNGLGDNDSWDSTQDDNSKDAGNTSDTDGDYDYSSNSWDDNDVESGKKDVRKQAVVIIAISLGILICVFSIIGWANKRKNSPPKQNSVKVEQTVKNTGNKPTVNTGTNTGTSVYSKSSWIEITSQEQIENLSEVELTFTVTDIDNQARTISGSDNLELRTKITGSLSGLPGAYEMVLPYSKGSKLSVGNSFTVKVLMGNYGDKTTVCGIEY